MQSTTPLSQGLLDLPAEIRIIIYSFLLICRSNSHVSIYHNSTLTRNYTSHITGLSRSIAILRVCKLIQKEAAPVLYGSNKFVFCSMFFPNFLAQIGIKSVSLLREVELNCIIYQEGLGRGARMLGSAVSMKKLTLGNDLWSPERPKLMAYTLWPMVKSLDAARKSKSCPTQTQTDVLEILEFVQQVFSEDQLRLPKEQARDEAVNFTSQVREILRENLLLGA
ncbi:uncharacterized protein MYCFIDRAFT_216906 [Pseudocercospora fijiensis CIRAD86]|uniref:F-box domain-containing protein n=1 Tax=Pseudocercospora fijiensis (strain CIRAD86) TaxID=383855 RepID=M3AK88_PSEFD|nr:uncharacterized protein MYCFIDRAFT_216906 [Pseudocercospora fijiensis CIRAD86]EME77872.1 hypothetical protein MYCFIDRAFT_216906 [Pseudocercospora fijiensis CIRAD86]